MPNPTGLNLKLKYLRIDPTVDNPDHLPAQPALVHLKGNKTKTKVVPVLPMFEHDKCIGCLAEDNYALDGKKPRIDCFQLPQCDGTIYVRANPTNLLRHIEWRLEYDK